MSRSIKISTMDQAEDYINRQNRQLNSLERQLDSVAKEAGKVAAQEAEKRAASLRAQMDRMDKNFTTIVNELESDMAQMDTEHKLALKKQAKDFYNNLNKLQNWTQDTITDLGRQIDESLGMQQKHINHIRNDIKQLYEKEANENNKASLMLKDLTILIDNVEKDKLHAKYAPGKLAKIQRNLNNLRNTNDPAAAIIAGARNLTTQLWDLEEDILLAQLRFEALHNLAMKLAMELLEIMHKNRDNTCFTDEDGENLKDNDGNEIQIEIDYWTKGEYSKFEIRVRELTEILNVEKERPELTEERVTEILAELNEIREKQNQLVITALKRGLASEERVKISEDIIDAMLQQGFELNTLSNGDAAHNYLGGEIESDQREGVFAVLRNGVGTEITVIIHPDETLTKNSIIFQRNDDSSLNESELLRSVSEVSGIIEKKGYNLGNITSPEGTGDRSQIELADREALIKVGLNDSIKKRLGLMSKKKM